MENTNHSNENDFINFFRGLDEKYQQFLIDEMKKKPPDNPYQKSIDLMNDDIADFEQRKSNMTESDGDPESR